MSERYDPQAVEDSPGRGDYMTRKDAKWIALILVMMVLAGVPIYLYANENKNKKLCSNNSKAIADALALYAQDNEDRLPALYSRGADGYPARTGAAAPETWATAISDRMPKGTEFRCPASAPEETSRTMVVNGFAANGEAPIDYGLYAAHETLAISSILSPDETVLIAETTNAGALGSYDPLPFPDRNDAFVIGWSDSNERPSRDTRAVTRLAVRNTNGGRFGSEAGTRHSAGIHAITVTGRRVLLGPSSSFTQWRIYNLTGRWRSQP